MEPAAWCVPQRFASDVVFLTGAGISADAPSNGPVGPELARRALSYAFLDETMREVARAFEAVEVVPPRSLPRLEAVLDVAVRTHGDKILGELLSDLELAAPNALHAFFRGHASLGGNHLTANFDSLIEDGGADFGIVHFHGRMAAGSDKYTDLGATLSRIERGFSADMRTAILRSIAGASPRTLVVVGYSGLDFFDMDPLVVDSGPDLARLLAEVIWVDHDFEAAPGSYATDDKPNESWPPMLRTLAGAGVRCIRVRGLTAGVLTDFARQWGLPDVMPEARQAKVWAPRASLRIEDRAEASRRLYLHMGLFRSHDRLIAQFPFLVTNVTSGEAAEVHWQRGRIREAKRAWQQEYAGDLIEMRARCEERMAACLWARGSLLRAYRRALRASQLAQTAQDDEITALCLETRARVLIHIARVPGVRWFASHSRRNGVLRQLHSASEKVLGVHLQARLRDAAALLENDPESHRVSAAEYMQGDSPPRTEVFNQFESLSALLDYRRGYERRRAASQRGVAISYQWMETYQNGAAALGKQAALLSLLSMPGAAMHYTPSQALRNVCTMSATPFHKLRLFASYLAQKRRWA